MNRISEIVEKHLPCYFISPHLDDAILSASGLISYLADKTDVTVISVFTRPSPAPYTRFCKKCGFTNAYDFFAKRRSEDQSILRSLRVRFQHLGFIDAAWRKKDNPSWMERVIGHVFPETLHRYPFQWNFLSEKIHPEDLSVVDVVQRALGTSISLNDKSVMFCPLGLGGHVDHIIVRQACMNAFRHPIFWEDFPYSLNGCQSKQIHTKPEDRITWAKMVEKKLELMKRYVTQSSFLSPFYQIVPVTETYVTKVEMAQRPERQFIRTYLEAIFGGRSQNVGTYPAYGQTG